KLFIGTKRNNVGHLSFEAHRDFEIPRSITVSRKNDGWFVSFCYEDGAAASRNPIEIIGELAHQGGAVLREVTNGLDRGIVKPLQSATGETYDFTHEQKASIAREQKKIRKNQRRLSRQQKGSKRRERTKKRIGKSHDKLAN